MAESWRWPAMSRVLLDSASSIGLDSFRRILMHLHARYTGPELLIHATETPPLGPGFTAQQAADADALEVWVTSLEDIADTTVFRLMRRDAAIAVSQIGGF